MVGVCICTHRRPHGLRRLLESLEPLAKQQSFEIFVVDNHEAREGLAVVDQLIRSGYSVPISTAAVTAGGISAARNKVLSMAEGADLRFAALIDDDEWPSTDWLKQLLEVQALDNADAVGGPTRPVFEDTVDEQIKQCMYYGADLKLENNAPCKLQACGNVLLNLPALGALKPPYFDPQLGQSGGEDLEFFMRLSSAGLKMRWAEHAIVYEAVPRNRCSLNWLKHRVALISNTRVHIMAADAPSVLNYAISYSKTLVLGLVSLTYALRAKYEPKYELDALIQYAKFRGKLRAHMGRRMVRGENH